MPDLLKRPWVAASSYPGVILVANGLDVATVDSERNQGLTEFEAKSVAQHIVDLHNASLSPTADKWIELAALGEPNRSTWPWNGDPVLIHCRSIIPNEPGVTGQGRFAYRPGLGWDWWLINTDSQRDPPVRGICGPVSHVRRIVPPIEV